jgi:hypothetical protein
MTINIKGYDVLIDDEDYERVIGYNWQIFRGDGSRGEKYIYFIYHGVCRKGKKRDTSRLHRLIVNAPQGSIVDHIDGNTLNNHKFNLRICDSKGSARNRGLFKNNTSGYRGIFIRKGINKFRSKISINGITYNLGDYATAEAAAYVHEAVAKLAFGQFHRKPDYIIQKPECFVNVRSCKIEKLENGYSLRTETRGKRYTLGIFKTEQEAKNAHRMERTRIEIEKRNLLARKAIGENIID